MPLNSVNDQLHGSLVRNQHFTELLHLCHQGQWLCFYAEPNEDFLIIMGLQHCQFIHVVVMIVPFSFKFPI